MMYTWIIVLGVIILAVILYAGKSGSKILKSENPLDILNRRYANGDISKEEYEESKQSINLKK